MQTCELCVHSLCSLNDLCHLHMRSTHICPCEVITRLNPNRFSHRACACFTHSLRLKMSKLQQVALRFMIMVMTLMIFLWFLMDWSFPWFLCLFHRQWRLGWNHSKGNFYLWHLPIWGRVWWRCGGRLVWYYLAVPSLFLQIIHNRIKSQMTPFFKILHL